MGKSKSRILRKGVNDQFTTLTRADAIKKATKYLNEENLKDAKHLITMFGLSAEDVLEEGANYESVIALNNIFE